MQVHFREQKTQQQQQHGVAKCELDATWPTRFLKGWFCIWPMEKSPAGKSETEIELGSLAINLSPDFGLFLEI